MPNPASPAPPLHRLRWLAPALGEVRADSLVVCSGAQNALAALVLALTGHPAWASAGIVAAKETALTLPFAIPVFLLLRAIHVKCHQYD